VDAGTIYCTASLPLLKVRAGDGWMVTTRRCLAALVVLAVALGCRAVEHAHDKDIHPADVPENIIKAAKEKFQVGKFLTAEIRTCDKKLIHYSLEIQLRDKTTVDAYFDGDGKLFRTGVTATKETIPAAVKEAFGKQYADWTISEVNKETDLATSYEVYSVDMSKGAKQLEVDFAPDGTIVKTLELIDEE